MQIALDLIDNQKHEEKPLKEAIKKFKSAETSFLKDYEALPKSIKDRINKNLLSSEEKNELGVVTKKDDEMEEGEMGSLEDLKESLNIVETPEVISAAKNLEEEEIKENASMESLQAISSLRKERIISLAIACLD